MVLIVKGPSGDRERYANRETAEEQLTVAAEYLADGLRTGQRVIYAAQSTDAVARFRRAVTQLSIEVWKWKAIYETPSVARNRTADVIGLPTKLTHRGRA